VTPRGVLLCPPDHYDVVDVKNPFMEGQAGRVDAARAHAQWDALRDTLEEIGLEVDVLEPVAGCEDMVFTANASFPAPGRCVLAQMRFDSRQPEVGAHAEWFQEHGYETIACPHRFEGGGDAIWHPGGGRLWVGAGPRTGREAHRFLAGVFKVPLHTLPLATPDFYHLDTCFCPLDEETVLLYPPALRPEGLALVREHFPRVIEVAEEDARRRLACNALAWRDHVVLQRGSARLERLLDELGYAVHPVETGEFLRSGGSVYCLKQWTY